MSLPRLEFEALPREFEALEEWAVSLEGIEGDKPFSMARFTVAPGCASPPDSHSVTEIWLVLDGTGTVRYDGGSYPVGKGDLLCFAPFGEHVATADPAGPLSVLSIWWRSSR
ncbi:cupin domain-containing protein [Sphaerisporangium sp. TRM90804]|uniref:cupin domain-containing protein n=1 Tax=Sphaerisporangium sp. TRM90804 TaxID=3031113 RepID=UPI0024486F7F|nr:cupin domain-containing protein [Sphaerisporangium sp. TRM90804]MDH2425012.1 cupin domain-containing protein [Sphaerisporangium sp. TRM90804]